MAVDLSLTKDGRGWILHDKPLPAVPEWIDYDADMANLTLVLEDGSTIDFGMPIQAKMRPLLRQAQSLYVVQFTDKEVRDMSLVPVTVRESTRH
jgi:hypothetical protein